MLDQSMAEMGIEEYTRMGSCYQSVEYSRTDKHNITLMAIFA